MMFVYFTIPDVTPFVNIYLDDRERFERRINPTFNGPSNKNRSDLFSRVRVGAEYSGKSGFSGKIEYQNASDVFWTHAGNASTDNSDASLAYLAYKKSSFAVIAGRQKVELGQMRLIGPTEWLSLARSFDGVRGELGQWDAWAAKLGVANTKPETARIEDITHKDSTWGTTSLILKHDVATVGKIDIQTLDHFATLNVGAIRFDGEGAFQFGQDNGRDQRAWAYHLRASDSVCSKTTLSLEANSASGGGNASTGRTFDNLYPSNHGLYGLADMIAWKNMNDYTFKVENQSIPAVTLRAGIHALSLRDPADAWYSATSTVIFKDATGKSGRNIGDEYDLEALYTIKRAGVISAGLAILEPGDYVKNASGHSDRFTYGYLQFQTKF